MKLKTREEAYALSAFQLHSILSLASTAQQIPPQTADKAPSLSDGGFNRILQKYARPSERGEAELRPNNEGVQPSKPQRRDNAVQAKEYPDAEGMAEEAAVADTADQDVAAVEELPDAEILALLASISLQPQNDAIEVSAPEAEQAQAEILHAEALPVQEEGVPYDVLLAEPDEGMQSIVTQERPWIREQNEASSEPVVDAMLTQESAPRAAVPVEQNDQATAQQQDSSEEAPVAHAEVLPMPGIQSDGTFVVSREVAPLNQELPAVNVAEQIIDRLVTTVAQGSTTCEIDLKPEHLGKVAIALTMTEQGLTATIRAQDEGVRHLIAAQLYELRNTLQSQGVRVVEMEVVYDNFQENLGEQTDHPRDAQQDASRHGRSVMRLGIESLADARGYDFMTAVDYGEHTGVEISA